MGLYGLEAKSLYFTPSTVELIYNPKTLKTYMANVENGKKAFLLKKELI